MVEQNLGNLQGLWQPTTPEDRAIDLEWRNSTGFGLSELGLTPEEVGFLGTPFRNPIDQIALSYLLKEGAIRTKEPLALGEGQELPTIERAKLLVGRLEGKEGLSNYLKGHARVIKFVQEFADEVIASGLDTGRD